VVRVFTVGLLGYATAISGCGRGGREATEPNPNMPVITRTAAEGPVTLTLTAAPSELPFTEHALVTLEVRADKGVTVDFPGYDRGLSDDEHRFEYRITPGDWGERDRGGSVNAVPTKDGKLRWTDRYDVEFFLPGEYELPPAVVSFVDLREASAGQTETADPAPRELKTESLTIAARDPSGKKLSPEELKTITVLPPVELPQPWSLWWWAALGFAAALIGTGILWSRRRRGLWAAVEIVLPAHEWAQWQIARLIAEDLIVKGRVYDFYYRISDIVRGYVERRFAVTAPEMTTEEFLAAASSDARFGEENTAELDRFLEACDLVKYARYEPGPSEAEAVLRAAGGFVERTRPRESRINGNGTAPAGARCNRRVKGESDRIGSTNAE